MIAQYLASAAEAASRLDPAVSQDLCSLLRVASGEAERVRKACRKTAAQKKPAARTAKKPAMAELTAEVEVTSRQPRGRRKAAAAPIANGAAAH